MSNHLIYSALTADDSDDSFDETKCGQCVLAGGEHQDTATEQLVAVSQQAIPEANQAVSQQGYDPPLAIVTPPKKKIRARKQRILRKRWHAQ